MNKRHYEHTLPNIRGSLSNTYRERITAGKGILGQRLRAALRRETESRGKHEGLVPETSACRTGRATEAEYLTTEESITSQLSFIY